MEIKSIKFSTNCNGKLNCSAFSTIRMKNENKYKLNEEYTIILKEQPIYIARIVSISHFKLDQLRPSMSYLDAGYAIPEFLKMMVLMYKKFNIDIYSVEWSYLILYHKTEL
jgi:hypothetical protein